ncbi:MAG: cytochrome c biogenesis protein CcmG/thiol:disulfide interchange protein DsbE [Limisphaerales bacterium]|jgi:cytochrome c biogenesis protein CcmG/thiol:disulfide interchange protein DsbE
MIAIMKGISRLYRNLTICLTLAALPTITLADDAPTLESSKNREAIDGMHGKPAPELKLKDWINSKALTNADLKGKIVLLDFWATWCGPCIRAVPHTNEMAEKYAKKGVVIIGVCAPRGGEKMAATAKQHNIKYAIALDIDGATMKAFKANSYPDYFIIDRKGNLRWGDIANRDAEKAIELLLKEDD